MERGGGLKQFYLKASTSAEIFPKCLLCSDIEHNTLKSRELSYIHIQILQLKFSQKREIITFKIEPLKVEAHVIQNE